MFLFSRSAGVSAETLIGVALLGGDQHFFELHSFGLRAGRRRRARSGVGVCRHCA